MELKCLTCIEPGSLIWKINACFSSSLEPKQICPGFLESSTKGQWDKLKSDGRRFCCPTWQIGDVACVVVCWVRGWDSDEQKWEKPKQNYVRDSTYSHKSQAGLLLTQNQAVQLKEATQKATWANENDSDGENYTDLH